MFENQTKKRFNLGWALIIPVFLTAAYVFNSFRVNTKPPVQFKLEYTQKGTLAEETFLVPAGDFHSYKIVLNRSEVLSGSFKTTGLTRRIGCVVLDGENFEKWRSGGEYKAVVETGFLPGGKINSVIGPGTFFLVFDNRTGENAETRQVEISFRIGE